MSYLVIGSVYGSPLGDIIPLQLQSAMQTLGDLGLTLLTACGGISTRRGMLAQSKAFAVSLNDLLSGNNERSALQEFSDEVSTGDTGTLLDWVNTRIGTVLVGAALLDDIVSLVIASVV
ncbi:hypothetical protein K437DRAFT_268534 [Tilletiaria anomala UBC 951]|uniref:Uncharacterized protein n=1 Tax=Tilletiaria anomala (strain ATCC 24038 / CBS 436.72 / UBC 951) TaxID=1037660 RepID=A0A066VXQ7_TILAU|nr:uncharacterized protein K437DRAFT_268534 [Tilletiaria anomala UBC 951]KDN45073.1 hypothetical protein K437DRAFT_268534 [Tilletiaria anomala UBC 951]